MKLSCYISNRTVCLEMDESELSGLQSLKITLVKNLDEWIRLIDMSISLFQYQKMIRPLETIDIEKYIQSALQTACVRLDALHMRLKRRSRNKVTTHSMLFLLSDILITNESFILLDRKISDRIINIIKDLIHGPSFDGDSIEKLRGLVISNFTAKDEPEKLYSEWLKTRYNLQLERFENTNSCQSKNDVSCQIYFDTLRLAMLKNVENNLKFIPSVVELGNFNSRCFTDFLKRFQISCAGPYRTQFEPNSLSNCEIIYFVNCSHEFDYVFNCNNSLSGIFQFPGKSIALRADFAQKYISKLPILPEWVQKKSP